MRHLLSCSKPGIVSQADSPERSIFFNTQSPAYDGLLEQTRDLIRSIIDIFNKSNIFRNGPGYGASRIDWLVGRDHPVYSEAKSRGLLIEGDVGYFNVNAGPVGGLTGDTDGFTSVDDVKDAASTA